MKDYREEYDIKLHNEIRWILEDYIGEFELKRECVDKIIEKVKFQLQEKDKVIEELLQEYKKAIESINKLVNSKDITGKSTAGFALGLILESSQKCIDKYKEAIK